MMRSSLTMAACALMLVVLGGTPALAHRYHPSCGSPDVTSIPARFLAPRWQYSAAYYNPPRGPKYFCFAGGGRHYPYRQYHWR
jgi:hypothetical protein